jgi:Fe-S cluster assembly iron-binding protein IscA
MIEVSEKTRSMFDTYFEKHEKAAIRIYMAAGGCSGPKLSLGLDDPKETDEVLEVDGLTFVVDKSLFEEAKPFAIDGVGMGIKVKSSLLLDNGDCSSCDGCG